MPNCRSPGRLLDRLPGALAVLVVVAALVSTAWGLDFGDESYFLSLIADPGANRDNGEIFLFGFLVHPFYVALGEDVALLRVASIVTMGAVAWWMATVVLSYVRELRTPGPERPREHRSVVLVVIASVVSAYALNVRVPNYRTVTLCGLMLLTIALVWAARGHALRSGLLIGCAWWLTLVGRPTTAAALLVIVSLVLVASRTMTVKLVVGGTLGVALAAGLTLLVARMEPMEAVEYLLRGYTQNQLMGGHTSVRRMLGLVPPQVGGFLVLGLPVLALAAIAAALVQRADRVGPVVIRTTGVAFVVVSAVTVLATLGVAVGGNPAAALPMGLIIPAWAAILLLLNGGERLSPSHGEKRVLFIVALLAVAPYIASVGTNSTFTHTMPMASTFWTLAAFIVAQGSTGSQPAARATALITAGVCLSVPGVYLAVLAGELGLGDGGSASRSVTVAGGALRMVAPDSDVLDLLSSVAKEEGISLRTPVADLTGVGAGYRFQLGVHPVGRPFLFGIFPGAEKAAQYSFSWESCNERSRAWLLYAPDNPLDVSEGFTGGVLNLQTDYQPVATFSPTQGPAEWRDLRIQVLKPTANVARKLGCLAGQ